MLGERENQFSLTRVALSTGGAAKSKFLSVRFALLPSESFRRGIPLRRYTHRFRQHPVSRLIKICRAWRSRLG
jgi:hypothetical protein